MIGDSWSSPECVREGHHWELPPQDVALKREASLWTAVFPRGQNRPSPPQGLCPALGFLTPHPRDQLVLPLKSLANGPPLPVTLSVNTLAPEGGTPS